MGKKDNKKKGKGAEKTAAKTQKKADLLVKKKLQAKGEMDLETMLAKIEEDSKKQTEIVEVKLKEPPSKRSSFTLTPHPEKDQLIMFGGEYFNGSQAFVYNDLFLYAPKQARWTQVKSRGPAPRSGHQACAVPTAGGQLWVFGGEFTNQSETQFYHYKDFWMFSLASKQWQKITVPGAPSSRSGHRMVVSKRKLYVFGGFHDYDNGDFKYFSDVHVFDMDAFTWTKLAPSGAAPAPRSACGLAALSDGRLLVYGGYTKTKDKAGREQGATLTDMFLLVPDKHDATGLKCKWVKVSQSGDKPEPARCSFAFTACHPVPGLAGWGEDKAVLFGGVTDKEEGDSDDLEATSIHGDMWLLDLSTQRWSELFVTGKRTEVKKARRRNKDRDEEGGDEEADEGEEMAEDIEALAVEPQETVAECGAFTITQSIGGSSDGGSVAAVGAALTTQRGAVFGPPPRMSGVATARGGRLYLWGGRYETGGKELTLNDRYSLDLSKLEEWTVIQALDPKDLEWFESDSESESEEESEDEEDSDEEMES